LAIRNYTDLVAWQKAMDFAEKVYEVSSCFPRDELYGLTRQLRDAAVSVPSNIAEGQGRMSDREFVHFLRIAHGSLREAETQIHLCGRLRYIGDQPRISLLELAAEVGRLINGLMRTINKSKSPAVSNSRPPAAHCPPPAYSALT
jgi:four helix bundle protein